MREAISAAPAITFASGYSHRRSLGDNRTLETIRRFWWRAFDRVCDCIVLIRLSIFGHIYGPEPPTPADEKREADHERLLMAFPAAAEAIEPVKYHAGQNQGGRLGSPYS
jgi:hypothetical protein